jgi:hypothetical protein
MYISHLLLQLVHGYQIRCIDIINLSFSFSPSSFYIPIFFFFFAKFRCVNTNQVTTTISIKKRERKKKSRQIFYVLIGCQLYFYIYSNWFVVLFFPYRFTNYLVHNFFVYYIHIGFLMTTTTTLKIKFLTYKQEDIWSGYS